VRDELALEISQKLGIESAVLRQELKHVATNRSAAAVRAPAEAQVTDAERLLIRALASASQMTTGEGHVSGRDGVDDEFDPAAQAHFALRSEQLHEGVATESLIETLLNAGESTTDVMQLAASDADRRLLASILHKESLDGRWSGRTKSGMTMARVETVFRPSRVAEPLPRSDCRAKRCLYSKYPNRLKLKGALGHLNSEGNWSPGFWPGQRVYEYAECTWRAILCKFVPTHNPAIPSSHR
jgi:hypothetical protein